MDLEDYQLNMVKNLAAFLACIGNYQEIPSNELQHLFIDLINNYKSLLEMKIGIKYYNLLIQKLEID